MSDEQFTEAPWSVRSYEFGFDKAEIQSDPLSKDVGYRPVAEATGVSEDELIANANLIGAAPQMYKALKKVNSLLYSYQGDPEGTVNKIADAIREPLQKAQGNDGSRQEKTTG